MPVNELDVVQSLYWTFGYGPSDERAKILAERLDLHRARDAVALRRAVTASEEFRGLLAAQLRQPRNPPLDLDRPRLVFLHMPKCAGTTLHDTLRQHFEPAEICPERFNGLRGWTLAELAGYTLFSGHFDLESVRALAGRNTRVVTLLRDPHDRLISLYHYMAIHTPEGDQVSGSMVPLARDLSIEDFYRHPAIRTHPSVRDAMTGVLVQPQAAVRWEALDARLDEAGPLLADPERALASAWAALEGMAGFGLQERFGDSLELLSAALGLPLREEPAQQVTAVLQTRPLLRPVERPRHTPELSAILDDLTALDRRLHARARALFDDRLAAVRRARPARVPPATEAGAAQAVPFDRFEMREARRDGDRIVASGRAGDLMVGPYLAVGHGRYALVCHFTRGDGAPGQPFDIGIWHNKGNGKVVAATWTGPSPSVTPFALPFDVAALEFVVTVGPDSELELLAIELRRLDGDAAGTPGLTRTADDGSAPPTDRPYRIA